MFEVITIGGGDYIVNVFNAVAAWTGGGGYKSMLQCVLVNGQIQKLQERGSYLLALAVSVRCI